MNFDIIYWGGNTIEEYVLDNQKSLKKYWPNFFYLDYNTKKTLVRNLDLRKKVSKDFKKWLNYSLENRTAAKNRMFIKEV